MIALDGVSGRCRRSCAPTYVPEAFGLGGKDAGAQFLALARTLPYSGFDVFCETAANDVAVFLNFFFWEQCDFSAEGVSLPQRDEVLCKLKKVWTERGLASAPLRVT